MAVNTPNEIDRLIGENLALIRQRTGVSAQKLALAIGVSASALSKWEQGKARISGANLYDLSRLLDVEVAAFFSGLPGSGTRSAKDVLALSPEESEIVHLLSGRTKAEHKRVAAAIRAHFSPDT